MAPSDDNRQIYEASGVIDIYREVAPPQQAELNIFEPLDKELRTGRLLDIGIGAGRTTAYLAPKVAHYVGVDYSHGLVDAAKQLYPEAEILWCDARDMSTFEGGSFDFVNFSFNGLDSLDHDGRLHVLSEVQRVLKPNGYWMFSSHNRDYHRRGLMPWQGDIALNRRWLRQVAHAMISFRNWRRLRKEQVETTEYAIVNDEAHRYSLLHYYVTPEQQIHQLEAAGFSHITVLDQVGDPLTGKSPESVWLYYVCRRNNRS